MKIEGLRLFMFVKPHRGRALHSVLGSSAWSMSTTTSLVEEGNEIQQTYATWNKKKRRQNAKGESLRITSMIQWGTVYYGPGRQ